MTLLAFILLMIRLTNVVPTLILVSVYFYLRRHYGLRDQRDDEMEETPDTIDQQRKKLKEWNK